MIFNLMVAKPKYPSLISQQFNHKPSKNIPVYPPVIKILLRLQMVASSEKVNEDVVDIPDTDETQRAAVMLQAWLDAWRPLEDR